MAEAKNNFLKAKMNQDLDDRLLPNGEYRTAQNILVGKSEEDSVGTVENIKGNTVLSSTQISDGIYGPMNIIGYFMDATNDRIFTFLTDFTGVDIENNPIASTPSDAHCSIRVYSINTDTYSILVEGSFLNFSTQNPIIAVNLLEDLLFFTDNRNQPRKINVNIALSEGASHYYKENHISVAKYNPYQPISLVKEIKETVISKDPVSQAIFDVEENLEIVSGMVVVVLDGNSEVISGTDGVVVLTAAPSSTPGQTTVTISQVGYNIEPGYTACFLASTMTDQADVVTWPGDPDYLEDKFVRFAYRFKFEDNEYSIFSPFTQIAFIPKQDGYFLGKEKEAVSSTILSWFENRINNIELIIPLPDKANKINSSYKISSIDVLYKESDSIVVKVLDTINTNSLTSENTFYTYSYQSRKPIRTLPQDQTVRVYDKVPVVAKTQEISSNRIIYGNFLTKHTPPDVINYTVNFQPKLATCDYPDFVEYPNHNVKQNRNYQVGFVLSDKFGRQSDVILSPVSKSTTSGGGFGGSTIYAEYIQDDPAGSGIHDPSFMPNGVQGWQGNSLIVQVNDPIQGNFDTPLYATPTGNSAGFELDKTTSTTITETTYTFTVTTSTPVNNIPVKNNHLRGKFIDYVEVTGVDSSSAPTYTLTMSGQVSDSYALNQANNKDLKFAYVINPLGWYSYKVVVKQTEQDYYNVYLPSAFAAENLLEDSTDTNSRVSYLTLINDNINKIPRDLSEVGPDQKQYRSSVRLFGRVNPFVEGSAPNYIFQNQQYFPSRLSDTSTSVGNAQDLIGEDKNQSRTWSAVIYDTPNPITASTIKVIGQEPFNEIPQYAILTDTDATGFTVGTQVISSTNTGIRRQTTPFEASGMTAIIKLNASLNIANENYVNFKISPGDYIYQAESNPILARISTEKQFGLNWQFFEADTASDPEERFSLAVYETEPVTSALDIYWESSSSGLLSDINESIALDYDGPVEIQDPLFELFETDPIGHVVTNNTFKPLDQLGVELPLTSPGAFSVIELNSGLDITNKFELLQVTDPNDLDFGSYYIETRSLFTYVFQSSSTDIYVFNIQFLNDDPNTDWESGSVSFQGRLENKPPSFTIPTPPIYEITPNAQANALIHDFSNNNPLNGTIDVNRNTEGLSWRIVGGNDQGYFNLDIKSGELKLSALGVLAGNGTYPIDIELTDATDASGNQTLPGTLSDTKTVEIVKGYARTGFSSVSNCQNFQLTSSIIYKDFVCYLSKFNYADSEFSSFLPSTVYDLELVKLADFLEQGEFVFGMEGWGLYPDQNNLSSNVGCTFSLEAYKRKVDANGDVVPGALWIEAKDLNNRDNSDYATGMSILNLINTGDPSIPAGNFNPGYAGDYQFSSYWAGNDPLYEYAFYMRATKKISNGDPFIGGCFTLRDLHYNGTVNNNSEQVIYKFTYDGTRDVYCDSPLHEFNKQYFEDVNLTTPVQVNPPTFSGLDGSFELLSREPFDGNPAVNLKDRYVNFEDFQQGTTRSTPYSWFQRGLAYFDIDNKADENNSPITLTQKYPDYAPGSQSQWITYTTFPYATPWMRGLDTSDSTDNVYWSD